MFYNTCVLQHLYPKNSVKYLERAECTSAICDKTVVVSQRNWSLSVSSSVHKHCIKSHNSCIRQFQTILLPFQSHTDTAITVTTVVSEHFSGITVHY